MVERAGEDSGTNIEPLGTAESRLGHVACLRRLRPLAWRLSYLVLAAGIETRPLDPRLTPPSDHLGTNTEYVVLFGAFLVSPLRMLNGRSLYEVSVQKYLQQ
ncbi:hypothetical protein N7485_005046 [Penicillium canescens]|nr:hypothetical protein N7485_005046 [Penicillium canescens]